MLFIFLQLSLVIQRIFFFSNIYPYTHDIVAHDLAIIY